MKIARLPFKGLIWCLGLLGIVSLMAVCCFAQMIPSSIESDRARPQIKVELPKIQTDPDHVDYFFEPGVYGYKKGEPYPMVHVRIPKKPYFDPNSSSGPARDYSLNVTMFYPNFSGLADEENAECRTDAKQAKGNFGHCRRQLMIQFGYAHEGARNEEIMLKNLDSDLAKKHVESIDEKSIYPGLDLVGENITDQRNIYYDARVTTYVSRTEKGERQYVIRCSEHVYSPGCEVTFRATRSPYIFIKLNFVFLLLPQWHELIDSTRKKIDSMIVQTYQVTLKE